VALLIVSLKNTIFDGTVFLGHGRFVFTSALVFRTNELGRPVFPQPRARTPGK
jgi:hypothetical protein